MAKDAPLLSNVSVEPSMWVTSTVKEDIELEVGSVVEKL